MTKKFNSSHLSMIRKRTELFLKESKDKRIQFLSVEILKEINQLETEIEHLLWEAEMEIRKFHRDMARRLEAEMDDDSGEIANNTKGETQYDDEI